MVNFEKSSESPSQEELERYLQEYEEKTGKKFVMGSSFEAERPRRPLLPRRNKNN